jgi:hypothetical protein
MITLKKISIFNDNPEKHISYIVFVGISLDAMSGRPKEFEKKREMVMEDCKYYVNTGLKKKRALEIALKAVLAVNDDYCVVEEDDTEGNGGKKNVKFKQALTNAENELGLPEADRWNNHAYEHQRRMLDFIDNAVWAEQQRRAENDEVVKRTKTRRNYDEEALNEYIRATFPLSEADMAVIRMQAVNEAVTRAKVDGSRGGPNPLLSPTEKLLVTRLVSMNNIYSRQKGGSGSKDLKKIVEDIAQKKDVSHNQLAQLKKELPMGFKENKTIAKIRRDASTESSMDAWYKTIDERMDKLYQKLITKELDSVMLICFDETSLTIAQKDHVVGKFKYLKTIYDQRREVSKPGQQTTNPVTMEYMMGLMITYNEEFEKIIIVPVAIPPIFCNPNKNTIDEDVLKLFHTSKFTVFFADNDERTGGVRKSMMTNIFDHMFRHVKNAVDATPHPRCKFVVYMDNASVHFDLALFNSIFLSSDPAARKNVEMWFGRPNTTHWSAPNDSTFCFGVIKKEYYDLIKKIAKENIGITDMITAAMAAAKKNTPALIAESFSTVGFIGCKHTSSTISSAVISKITTSFNNNSNCLQKETAWTVRIMCGKVLAEARASQIRKFATRGGSASDVDFVHDEVDAITYGLSTEARLRAVDTIQRLQEAKEREESENKEKAKCATEKKSSKAAGSTAFNRSTALLAEIREGGVLNEELFQKEMELREERDAMLKKKQLEEEAAKQEKKRKAKELEEKRAKRIAVRKDQTEKTKPEWIQAFFGYFVEVQRDKAAHEKKSLTFNEILDSFESKVSYSFSEAVVNQYRDVFGIENDLEHDEEAQEGAPQDDDDDNDDAE